jgi:hypothetical protein
MAIPEGPTPIMIADGELLMGWPVAARKVCGATVIIVPPARPPAMSWWRWMESGEGLRNRKFEWKVKGTEIRKETNSETITEVKQSLTAIKQRKCQLYLVII